MIARWLTINILTVFIIIFWSLYQGYDSNYILIGKIAAQAAFVLFLFNINMYFVFLLIRKSKIRNIRWEHLWEVKIISGTVTICILIFLLFSGLLRRWKATGKRRRFHYIMAFVFFGFVIFHIFL